MKLNFISFALCFIILGFISCGGKDSKLSLTNLQGSALSKQTEGQTNISRFTADRDTILRSLEEIADLERAGSWFQGMSLTESGLRENAEDYAGAVTALYKELAYMYSLGLIKKEYVEICLTNIMDSRGEDAVIASSVNGVLAFMREQWTQASNTLYGAAACAAVPDRLSFSITQNPVFILPLFTEYLIQA